MLHLVYTVIGCSQDYAKCAEFFIKALLVHTPYPNFDIFILCEEKLIHYVKQILINVIVECSHNRPNAINKHLKFASLSHTPTPICASMQKLRLFDIDEIFNYKYALYIDLDIICLTNINNIFVAYDDYLLHNPHQKHKLQACPEKESAKDHHEIFWSMNNYTHDDIMFFEKNKIFPFNAGCFLFPINSIFKEYFHHIREMIIKSISEGKIFFYEQAYMNVFFNKRDIVAYDLINKSNYVMFPNLNINYTNKIIHFCGSPGQGSIKYDMIKTYIEKHDIFHDEQKEKKEKEEKEENIMSFEKKTRPCPNIL